MENSNGIKNITNMLAALNLKNKGQRVGKPVTTDLILGKSYILGDNLGRSFILYEIEDNTLKGRYRDDTLKVTSFTGTFSRVANLANLASTTKFAVNKSNKSIHASEIA